MSVTIVDDPAPLNPYFNFPYATTPMPLSDLVTQELVVVPKALEGPAPQNPQQFEP